MTSGTRAVVPAGGAAGLIVKQTPEDRIAVKLDQLRLETVRRGQERREFVRKEATQACQEEAAARLKRAERLFAEEFVKRAGSLHGVGREELRKLNDLDDEELMSLRHMLDRGARKDMKARLLAGAWAPFLIPAGIFFWSLGNLWPLLGIFVGFFGVLSLGTAVAPPDNIRLSSELEKAYGKDYFPVRAVRKELTAQYMGGADGWQPQSRRS